MNKSPPKFSAQVEDFCNAAAEARLTYDWNVEQLENLDKLTQDYLHQLELGNLSYSERAKVATQLAKCRRLRRESKDTIEILEPFVSFLNSEKGKSLGNLLKEVLGKTRKTEDKMKTRVYRYRVLSENEVII